MFGTNFLPVDHLLRCKLFFTPPIEVIGKYINNHTIDCDVPPLPINPTPGSEFKLVIEISQNGGIQYTKDGLYFIYRPKDNMTSLYPMRGFTYGNTFLRIGYSYFYDKVGLR